MSDADKDSGKADAAAHRLEEMRKLLAVWFRRRVPDPAEAEDLVQESLLRFSQRGEAEEVSNFEGYLYRTAESVLADRRRRRHVRQTDDHVSLEPEQVQAEDPDALRTLLARERLDQVSATLMALPERTRSIFILRRIEGLRYAEIATRFGISVSAVEKHMTRAVEYLLLNAGDPM